MNTNMKIMKMLGINIKEKHAIGATVVMKPNKQPTITLTLAMETKDGETREEEFTILPKISCKGCLHSDESPKGYDFVYCSKFLTDRPHDGVCEMATV